MSTKTSIKRIALVAVSALGFGLLSVMPAKADNVTATVTPVRIVGDTPPYAKISWTTTAALVATDTATLTLTSAPTAAAKMKIAAKASIGATTGGAIGAVGAGIDSLSGTGTALALVAGDATAAAGTASLAVTVDVAGTYIGTIAVAKADTTAVDTVSFSFTTRGAVASYTFTSDAITTSAGGLVTATVTLADAAGNTTQPSMVDTVTLTDDTAGSWTDGSLDASDLYAGTITDTYTQPGTASTASTLTATPGGTLVAAGLAAKTIAITTDTTVVSAVAMPVQAAAPAAGANNTSFAVTVPSGVTDADGGGDTDNSDITANIPTGTSSVTVTALMAAASTTYRFKGVVSAGTLNGTGTTTAYVNATTNASSVATISFTLAGNALAEGATLTITQVTVLNVAVAGLNAVLTQAAPTVTATSITQSPNGSMVKALGSSNDMVVTVKSNYGALLGSGYVVNLFRGATVAGGTLISSATTGSASTATVTFTNATGAVSGASEQYSVQVVPPTGSAVADNAIATVVYTTTGNITSLSVGIDGTTAALQTALGVADADITDTEATTLDKIAVVTVPSSGTVTETAAQDEIYDISDAAVVAGGTSSNTIRLAANATDDNSATYTTSTGAFVSTAAGIAWNAGVTSLEVAEGTVVYAYATKVGMHTVTVTSGGKTVAIKFWAKNVATDYYTVSATADSTSLSTGGNGLVTMTIKDMFGNVVDPAANLITATAANKVRLAGQALTQALDTAANGTAQFTVIADGAPGTGTITLAPTTTGAQAWATGYDYAAKGFAAPTSSTTVSFTVSGTAVKTNDEVYAQAVDAEDEAAKATAKAAEALTAATTAGTKADAAKDAADAAGTKADAAKDAAAKAGTDAVAAAKAAETAAVAAADAAKAEAAKATAAATANAVEIAKLMAAITALTTSVSTGNSSASDAYEAAAEAIDAANAATDAANIAAEAADAATVAAEEARDAADAATAAVEELATQVSTLIASLKAQITTLGNTVAKIAKKVRA